MAYTLWKDENGKNTVEYALGIAFVAILTLAILFYFKIGIIGNYEEILKFIKK